MPEALLLVNMGGPSDLTQIKPYLRRIFADAAIIPLPGIVRWPLARLISARRAALVSKRYQRIGGGSPLPYWTQRLRTQTESVLRESGQESRVAYAFRYCSPTIAESLGILRESGIRNVNVFPLFPHYAKAMTGSIETECARVANSLGLSLRSTRDWWKQEAIIALWANQLERSLNVAGSDARVLFVAHGIPQRNVDRGEDYPTQVRSSAELVVRSLRCNVSWSLAFQSRVGPIAWTQPYIDSEITRLATSADPLVIMPLSFVSDCLETVYDLDLIAAQQARDLGISKVVRVPAFNDEIRFARAIVEIVSEKVHVS